MLKENCLKYTTNCSSNHPYAFIVRPLDTNNKDLRIMLMEITEEQENELDNNKTYKKDQINRYALKKLMEDFIANNRNHSMKEFKKEYEKFGKRTNMLSSKKLENNLQTFVYNQIRNETPKQCETAADNLKKHLSNAVRALGQVKGNINSLSDNNQKYIKVLRATKAISEEPDKKDSSKIRYSLIKDKIPNKEDFIDVSNKYLRFKRLIIQEFGSNEYGEAYGS